MQFAVKYQLENADTNNWKHGEVILSNHPAAGGSHLPDFTVITPVLSMILPTSNEIGVPSRGGERDPRGSKN